MTENFQHFTSPDKAIVGFYGLLNIQQYQLAFDCLTTDFKDRVWKNDINDFAKGYIYTIEIGMPRLSVIKQDENSAEYNVEYSDTMDALHHPLIDDLVGIENKDAPETLEKIAQFKEFMIQKLNADPKETADIMNARFFEPNNVEVCLWLGKADYIENNSELFPRSSETHEVYRRAICVNTPNGWLIEGLKRDRPVIS
jgi:hypothetical protein